MSQAIRSTKSSGTTRDRIAASDTLSKFELQQNQFFLVTAHRAENVDIENRLRKLVEILALLSEIYGFPVVCSLHPRTRAKYEAVRYRFGRPGMHFVEPLGFFDFVRLEQGAFCVLSDSGTVQEETCILGVPNVTIRDVTERPETIECGSNTLAGCEAQRILRQSRSHAGGQELAADLPEYLVPHVADTVIRIVLGSSLPGSA